MLDSKKGEERSVSETRNSVLLAAADETTAGAASSAPTPESRWQSGVEFRLRRNPRGGPPQSKKANSRFLTQVRQMRTLGSE
jgi:hypothetical protein